FLLVAAGERRSLLYDAQTLRLARTFDVGGVPAVSPASDRAAFGQADGTVIVVNLHSGRTTTFSGRATGSINAVSFSRDGDTLASADEDRTISVWNVRTRTLRETLKGHAAAAQEVLFSPDGRTLYTAGYDGSVIVWDLGGARRLGEPFRHTTQIDGAATGSAVDPNGSIYAVSPQPDRVSLWSAGTRTAIGPPLRGPVGYVRDVGFSPDGKLLATASLGGPTYVWEVASESIVSSLSGALAASAVRFSPDGKLVAVGDSSGRVVFWRLDPTHRFEGAWAARAVGQPL